MGEVYPIAEGNNFLYSLFRQYRTAVIALINSAFGRDYVEGDIIETYRANTVCVKADIVRRYDFLLVEGVCGSKMACMTESEDDYGFWGRKPVCNDNVLWMNMCNIAVIRPNWDRRGGGNIKCVIDSPGGVLEYAISVVNVDDSEPEFTNLLKRMLGE